jgi:lipoprotein-anchoring transpeptidase ErfK/SrfK
MKKLIGFLGFAFLFLAGGFYLFYFYLPSLDEPEGLSLEVKTEKETKQELGFLPIVSSQTTFLPEVKDIQALEAQREKEAEQLQAVIDQEAEAAKKVKKSKYQGAPIPDNFQTMASKVIEINLSTQTLSRWENGNKLDENQISSGKKGMATPTGVFNIRNKINIAYSRKYRLYMPYWMAFTPWGHGIHELPVFRNGKREGADHLGRPVSHGCVRLGVGPAQTIYDWAEVGTPVVIHY